MSSHRAHAFDAHYGRRSGERGPTVAPITPSVASLTFNLLAFEPFVQEIGGSLLEHLTSANDILGAQPAQLSASRSIQGILSEGGKFGGWSQQSSTRR